MQKLSGFLRFSWFPCHTPALVCYQGRTGGVKSTTAHHININNPTTTTTFAAAGLSTPAAGEKPPLPASHVTPHFNMGWTCLWSHRLATHIISSAGQIPHMIIAWNTHLGYRVLAYACTRHAKLLPLEVSRPPGQRPRSEAAFYMAALTNHQKQPPVPALLTWMHSMGVPQEKIRAFSTCKCWPRQLNWHTRCLIVTPGCWINRMCARRCVRATTVQGRLAWNPLPVILPSNKTQHVSLTNRLNSFRAYHSAVWKSPDPLLHADCSKEHRYSRAGAFLKISSRDHVYFKTSLKVRLCKRIASLLGAPAC